MKTKAYACYSLEKEIREKSSSGGMFSLLAEYMIEQGGVVFAACYDQEQHVVHRRIDRKEDIDQARGAKYVFSNMGTTVNEIRKILQEGKKILFVGTPCQCAGILSGFSTYREQLLCVDFVCHGVPDQKVWNHYLKALEKRDMGIAAVNMRAKDTGWSRYGYCWKIMTKDGRTIIQKQSENPYMRGFVSDFYLRESCYQCKWKGFERRTDFTLGDFWGIWDLHPEMDDDCGTSLVMIHTENGMQLFQNLEKKMKVLEVTEEEAVKYNPSVLHSARKTEKYDQFLKAMAEGEDFIITVDRMMKDTFWKKVKKKIKRLLYR